MHPPSLTTLSHEGGETEKREDEDKRGRNDLHIYRADSDTRVEKEYVNKRRRGGGGGGYVGQGMKSNESDWMDMNE